MDRMARILDVRRYGALIAVGAPIAVTLIGLNLLLLAMTGPSPDWLVPRHQPLGVEVVKEAESRVAGLQAQGAFRESDRCLLYLGMSTASEDIDPSVLQRESHMRTVGLCTKGSGMYRLVLLAEPFVAHRLHASLVILCVHAVWLAGSPTPAPPASINPLTPALHGEWRETLSRLQWWVWIKNNRGFLNHRVQQEMYRLRRMVGGVAPDDDPWRAPDRIARSLHKTPKQLAAQWREFAEWSWFDQASIARNREEQGNALRQVIRTFCDQGSEVVVVMMPEHSRLRAAVSPETTAYLVNLVRQERCHEGAAPLLKDFRDRIADENYSDYAHLNDTGRAAFSAILADAIRDRRATSAAVQAE